MYTILTGYLPFQGRDTKELFRKIQKAKPLNPVNAGNKVVSSEARDLLRKLLAIDVQQRLNAEEALKHPWFSKNLY